MSKKNKKKVEEEVKEVEEVQEEQPQKVNTPRDVKMKPTEWAIQEGLDPDLFLYWENQIMNKEEFEKLKMERGA